MILCNVYYKGILILSRVNRIIAEKIRENNKDDFSISYILGG